MRKRTLFTVRALAALWSGLARLGAPFLIRKRLKNGKEEKGRHKERFGETSAPRPKGTLAWLHGASVGESLSLLPVIAKIRETRPDMPFLLTTGTVSAAKILRERLPSDCVLQYLPYDAKPYVNGFLSHWRPAVAIFAESELWPNLLLGIKERSIRAFSLNARLSNESFKKWQRFPLMAEFLLSAFEKVYTQSDEFTERYERLGVKNAVTAGNIKVLAEPLPRDESELDFWRAYAGERPRWVAASTHPGEEEAILNVHLALKAKMPNLLTVIAPRHAERSLELLKRFSGVRVALFGNPIDNAEIILVDAYAKLGIFYESCPVAFIGNSLIANGGGHNPLEPVALGCLPLWGENFKNFADMLPLFAGVPCAQANEKTLAESVAKYLNDEALREKLVTVIRGNVETQRKNAERTVEAIVRSLVSSSS